MSAFREHFLDKYFGYRRRYVGAVAELAPHRRRLAVASEIARLAFSTAACALVAFIMGAALVHSIGRAGWFPLAVMAAIVAVSAVFIALCSAGLRAAWLDRADAETKEIA